MVDHLVALGGQVLDQVVAQFQAGVVGGDVHAHRLSLFVFLLR